MKKSTGFEKFHKTKKEPSLTNSMLEKATKRFEKEAKEQEDKDKAKAEKKGGKTWFKLNPPTQQAPKASKEAIKRKTVSGTIGRGIQVKLEQMPLNKYMAHCGVCSRREAVNIIATGKVKVNGSIVTLPSHKIAFNDEVMYGGKKLNPQKNLTYILLNKPKDFVTTTNDPQGRKTVMSLISEATKEKVYPVGRLDRNTTGVLLLTNDGDLTQILTHPKYEIKKIYAITLDKSVESKHVEALLEGVTLEDGFIKADALSYTDKTKSELGIEIHSGRNRIVRRMFEHFGYQVKNLDRVLFAGLTKKNVDRGKWRSLTEKEVRTLKHFTIKKEKKDKSDAPEPLHETDNLD
jgi:23S rRNA pseudouridine2605 synthase